MNLADTTHEPPSSAPMGESLDLKEQTYRLHRRFDRMGRLAGDAGMAKLFGAHVMVIGLGGVGSFAAEALARSGVGRLTLVDFDEVCITNFNRQLHAVAGTVGRKKAEVMAERLRKVHPQARIDAIARFYDADSSAELLGLGADYVIDAIDSVTSKCHLLNECRARGQRVVSCLGTGGRWDPLRLQSSDLARSKVDPLAREVRAILRGKHGFPDEGDFGIPAIWSDETPQKPHELGYDLGEGFHCVCPQGGNGVFDCDNRNLVWGNASFVTGSAGLAAAAHVVRDLTRGA